MKRIFIIAFALIAIVACNKDKFQTKPQVTIKGYNTREVNVNGHFEVTLEVTDKEGDVDDSLFIVRERLNKRIATPRFPYPYSIPDFPDKSSAEFKISFSPFASNLVAGLSPISIPGTGTPPDLEIDTLIFKFVVKDKAGNRSDTAISEPIYVRRR